MKTQKLKKPQLIGSRECPKYRFPAVQISDLETAVISPDGLGKASKCIQYTYLSPRFHDASLTSRSIQPTFAGRSSVAKRKNILVAGKPPAGLRKGGIRNHPLHQLYLRPYPRLLTGHPVSALGLSETFPHSQRASSSAALPAIPAHFPWTLSLLPAAAALST